ncbi:MAG: glycosyltransferase [Leptospirales bacterium]
MGQKVSGKASLSVCHILPGLPLHGAENLLFQICRHMNPEEVRTSVLLIVDKGPLVKEFEELGIPVTLIKKNGRYDFLIIKKIWNFLKEGQFDVVHTHLFTANLWGRLGTIFLDKSVITSAHSVVSGKNKPNSWVERMLDRMLVRFTDAVLCVTPQVMRSLRLEGGLPREKLVTIDNGIDLSIACDPVTRLEARNSLGLPTESPVLALVGRFSQPKNHIGLIEALPSVRERFPGLSVLFVGDGELEAKIRLAVQAHDLEDVVHFLGLRRDIPIILKALDAMVIPSFWEGLPIVLLEAMASRVPVIASRVGGIPDVITNGLTGLLVDCDVHSLSKGLIWALENPIKMSQMAEAAFELALERYDIRKTALQYTDLYRSSIRQRSFDRGIRDDARTLVGKTLSKRRKGNKTSRNTLRVLMYHRISEDSSKDILAVTPFVFREQMRWLKEEGFHILRAEDGLVRLREGTLEENSIVLTFDDGYRDNYEQAFPVLCRDNTPAMIFPVTGFVEGKLCHPRYLDRSSEVTYLTQYQIREMKHYGIDFGCHTHTHPLLTTVSDREVAEQIKESRNLLELWTGEAVRHFAYPNGFFRSGHFKILESFGFEAAFTVQPGVNSSSFSPWEIRRTEISGRDSLSHFSLKLRGGMDLWHSAYQRLSRR